MAISFDLNELSKEGFMINLDEDREEFLLKDYQRMITDVKANGGDTTTAKLTIIVKAEDYSVLRSYVESRNPQFIAEHDDVEDEAGLLIWKWMRAVNK